MNHTPIQGCIDTLRAANANMAEFTASPYARGRAIATAQMALQGLRHDEQAATIAAALVAQHGKTRAAMVLRKAMEMVG